MKKILLLIILGFVGFVTRAQPQRPLPGKPLAEWPTFRGNNNRDGRVVARGQFKDRASLSQSIDFATSEAYVEVTAGKKNLPVVYVKGKVGGADQLASLSSEWQTESDAYLDLYGDGKVTKVDISQRTKYAQLFNGDKKYYRIEAFDGFDVTSNENDDVFVGIRVYEGNSDKLVFEKKFPKEDFMQRPHVMVADMNNDGQKDIVINSWEGIYIFNNKGDEIGRLSQETKGWHHLRKRGFACVADIDGNGYKDVVIIGAYPYHVDVIKNNRGVLEFGWTEIFDGHIESAKKISKPILNSVNDFDGDGTYEVLVNVYNYNDEKNWSGVLFDATSGKVKAQIKGAFVLSAEDLNHDGKYVFFCSKTQGQSVPLVTTLQAVVFQNGAIRELLHIDKGDWINPRIANTSPVVTSHSDGISRLAEDAVLCVDYENIGQKAFFVQTKNPDGSSVIGGYYISRSGVARKTGLKITIPPGMYGEITRARKEADGKTGLLLQIKAFGIPGGTVQVAGGDSKDLGRYISPGKKNYTPVVADINGDGFEEILIANEVGEVLCYGRDSAGKLSLRWKVPGHGMLFQYSLIIDYGIAVDDLDHDGFKEVMVSGSNGVGAVMFVYDHRGKLLWQKEFPEINAGDFSTFDGNIAFFGTAQSSKRKNRDVIVTVQRVIQHRGKTYCLSGTDGSVIWELDTLTDDNGQGQTVSSGAGGNIFSTYDIDGDGSDEVMCGYGNILFFANSNDGAVEFKSFMRKMFLEKYDYPGKGYTSFWMAQILPVAFHDDDGKVLLSCMSTGVAAGTMNTSGALSWCPEVLAYDNRYWQCMADLDGDGKLWVVELSSRVSDHHPVLFGYDPINGAAHKTFSMEMPGFNPSFGSDVMPVACDMNGDGKDEIIVSNNTGVSCVGYKDGKMAVLWKYDASDCGPAVVADIDSDGFAEVVVATKNGKILVLDK